MNLTGYDLNKINDCALRNVIDMAKQPDETHEAFRARCWMLAVIEVFGSHGYDLAAIHKDTAATVLVSLSKPSR